MCDLCNDNRFELIEKFKKKLIESTNIETSPEEMKVIDNILFRFWQMGWLDKLELSSVQSECSCKTCRYVDEFSSEVFLCRRLKKTERVQPDFWCRKWRGEQDD